MQSAYPVVRQTGGKNAVELRPDLDWHKGAALFWLLDTMGLERHQVLPLYIDDDVTDEAAFTALEPEDIGIGRESTMSLIPLSIEGSHDHASFVIVSNLDAELTKTILSPIIFTI